jgi:hypothetical protein
VTLLFRPHQGPEFDSASNRNEYHCSSLGGGGGKGGCCVGLTTLSLSRARYPQVLGASKSSSHRRLFRVVQRQLYLYLVPYGTRLIYRVWRLTSCYSFLSSVFASRTTRFSVKQDRQCTYNVTLRRVHVTSVTVEKQ